MTDWGFHAHMAETSYSNLEDESMRALSVGMAVMLLLPGCGGGSSGDGGSLADPEQGPVYEVALIADSALPEGFCPAPLFAPGDLPEPILATSFPPSEVDPVFVFPTLTPTLRLDSGLELSLQIRFKIETNQEGQYVAVQFLGRRVPEDEFLHESEWVPFIQSVDPLDNQPFTAHADSLQPIPMWQLDGRFAGDRVEVIGSSCLGDFVFSPSGPSA